MEFTMTEPTRFPNAPITEALLDIRGNLPEHVDLAQLATFQDLIKDHYPSRHERVFWQSNFQLSQGGLAVVSANRWTSRLPFYIAGRKTARSGAAGWLYT